MVGSINEEPMETKYRQFRCEDWQQSFMECFLHTSLALIGKNI